MSLNRLYNDKLRIREMGEMLNSNDQIIFEILKQILSFWDSMSFMMWCRDFDV